MRLAAFFVRLFLCCLIMAAQPGMAHEVRPAALDILELADGRFEFRFRQPVRGEYTLSISPVLSSPWLDGEPQERHVTESALIRIWRVDPAGQPLAGQELSISGLDRTITDVLVSIHWAGGAVDRHLIKAASPVMIIESENESGAGVPEYLRLGLEHIWSGPDHLLYVLSLMLLIAGTRALLLTITAFTLAHSLTLAGAALNLVQLPSGPVEAIISLSIVYVAVELVHAKQGRAGIAARRPWLIAFIFGLLHGFGFAGALQEIGLPEQAVLGALLLFNLGIEIGQVLFVFALLGLMFLLRLLLARAQLLLAGFRTAVKGTLPYAIGSLASFWLIERLVSLV